MKLSFKRIWGMSLRNYYSLMRNLDRWVDLFYWPILDVVLMGLTFLALVHSQNVATSQFYIIITCVILWFMLWRGQYEITFGLVEDLISENLINTFSSPLSLLEWVLALFFMGIVKLAVSLISLSLLAFLLYKINFFAMGFILIPMIANLLVTGWCAGLFIGGLFLRKGTNVQSLTWAGAYLLHPLSAVFYPLSVLPAFLQKIALCLPSTYIFEETRLILSGHTISYELLLKSTLLNILYLILTFWFFNRSFKYARKNGLAHLK